MLELHIAKSIAQILKDLAEWQTPKTNGDRRPSYAKIYADYVLFVNTVPKQNHPHLKEIERLERAFSKILESIRNVNMLESVSMELEKEDKEKAELIIFGEFENTRSKLLLVIKDLCNNMANGLGNFFIQLYICYTLIIQEKIKSFELFDINSHIQARDKLIDLSGDDFGDYNDIADSVVESIDDTVPALIAYRKYRHTSRISSSKFYSSIMDKISNIERTIEDLMCYGLQ